MIPASAVLIEFFGRIHKSHNLHPAYDSFPRAGPEVLVPIQETYAEMLEIN